MRSARCARWRNGTRSCDGRRRAVHLRAVTGWKADTRRLTELCRLAQHSPFVSVDRAYEHERNDVDKRANDEAEQDEMPAGVHTEIDCNGHDERRSASSREHPNWQMQLE